MNEPIEKDQHADDHARALQLLITSLNQYLEEQDRSGCGDFVDAVNPGHYLHGAVMKVEVHYPSGKLPACARIPWLDLLQVSRGKRMTDRAVQEVTEAASKLLEWCGSELVAQSKFAALAKGPDLLRPEDRPPAPNRFAFKGKPPELPPPDAPDDLEADAPIPKIRVFSSDGRGTALWNQRRGRGDRCWFAPPAADYTESLHVSASGMILQCFHSKHPQLTGSAECGDLFDADSYAVGYTPAEAVDWLHRHHYAIPADLRIALDAAPRRLAEPVGPSSETLPEEFQCPPARRAGWESILPLYDNGQQIGIFDPGPCSLVASVNLNIPGLQATALFQTPTGDWILYKLQDERAERLDEASIPRCFLPDGDVEEWESDCRTLNVHELIVACEAWEKQCQDFWQLHALPNDDLAHLTEQLASEAEAHNLDSVALEQTAQSIGRISAMTLAGLLPIPPQVFADEELERAIAAGVNVVGRLKRRVRLGLPPADPTPEVQQVGAGKLATTHGPDFRSVNWFGKSFQFTSSQAACLRIWWQAWENGTPDVGDDYVCTDADVSGNLRALFQKHPAWGTTIVEGSTKGTHRLREPQE